MREKHEKEGGIMAADMSMIILLDLLDLLTSASSLALTCTAMYLWLLLPLGT